MKKFFVFVFMLAALILSAQVNIERIMPGKGSITYNAFYPAYFDPRKPMEQPIIFRLNITSSVGNNYQIECTLTYEDVVPAVITLTPLAGVPEEVIITNRNFVYEEGPGFLGFELSGDYDDFLAELEDDIINTGKMPDGQYLFHIEALVDGEIVDTDDVTVEVISPVTISLVAPGSPLGTTPAVISTQYPQFVWFSNLDDYTFKLYELDAIMNSSEEIERMYEPILAMENLSSTSFTYPSDAPGFNARNVYAWIVSAEIISPSGNTVENSIMYHFTLSQRGQTSMENQQVINFLNQLGNDQLKQMVTLLESGYSFAGLSWEGESADVEKLNEIVQKIMNGELQIEEITWE